jgi:hypothetical protein
MSSVVVTTMEKGGVDAVTLAKFWEFGIEGTIRMRLVITERWIKRMIQPSLTKRFKTNDMQLIYCPLHITLYTDTMYSPIKSITVNTVGQVFYGWTRAFPMKKEH